MQYHTIHQNLSIKLSSIVKLLIVAAILFAMLGANGGVASASANGITIQPADWQTLRRASIVKDGSHGKVVKIRPAKSGSPSATGVFTFGKATDAHPNGVPLEKLENFVAANFGKPAKVCVVARANSADSSVFLAINNFVAKQPGGTYFKGKYFDVKNGYGKHCFDFKIISKKAYQANQSSAEVWVENTNYGITLFVDTVKVSLR